MTDLNEDSRFYGVPLAKQTNTPDPPSGSPVSNEIPIDATGPKTAIDIQPKARDARGEDDGFSSGSRFPDADAADNGITVDSETGIRDLVAGMKLDSKTLEKLVSLLNIITARRDQRERDLVEHVRARVKDVEALALSESLTLFDRSNLFHEAMRAMNKPVREILSEQLRAKRSRPIKRADIFEEEYHPNPVAKPIRFDNDLVKEAWRVLG